MAMIMYMVTSVIIILATSAKLSVADDDSKPVNRIVNGIDADISEFPFVVSIQLNGVHECTGTILNENWILTAAHCFRGSIDVSTLTVVVGTRDPSQGGIKKNVQQLINHPGFKPSQKIYFYDIAVLKLDSSLSFDQSDIATVKISNQGDSQPSPGTLATVIGYGKYKAKGLVGSPLRKIELEILPTTVCYLTSEGINGQLFNPKYQICAVDRNQKICPCQGDSGGPLLVNGIQVGITSGGGKCDCAVSSLYTDIALYADWVSSNIA